MLRLLLTIKLKDSQQNRLDSLKFTDQSIDFNSPIEDDQILSMPNYQVPRNKPASVFDDPLAVAPGSSEQMRSTSSWSQQWYML